MGAQSSSKALVSFCTTGEIMGFHSIPYNSGRVVVLADVHLDHWQRHHQNPLEAFQLEDLLRSDIDALIIAGDLTNGPASNWAFTLEYIGKYLALDKVYCLPGNHDYYCGSLADDPLLAEVAEQAGAHFLQKSTLMHGSTRFLACTLWTDFELLGDRHDAMQVALLNMNDYRAIAKVSQKRQPEDSAELVSLARAHPEDLRNLHKDHLAWLIEQLQQPHPDKESGKTVVVSHHGPHLAVAGHIDRLSPAFHSNLEGVMARYAIDAWFFGHSHRHFRADIYKTDIRNVSLGYPDERANRIGYLDTACVWESPNG